MQKNSPRLNVAFPNEREAMLNAVMVANCDYFDF